MAKDSDSDRAESPKDLSPKDLVIKDLVIYDGNCNLCVNWVKLLVQWDQGQRFRYVPMQAEAELVPIGITPAVGTKGVMLIQGDNVNQRWQGSEAIEEISRRLPLGEALVAAYRALPGLKPLGDAAYGQIRDHRYAWFGQRESTHYVACETGGCENRPESK